MPLMKRSALIGSHARPAYRRVAALLVLVLTSALGLSMLSACGLRTGTGEIAFLQGNQLWTIQSDGSSARSVSDKTVLDFAWSPDHHQLVFRYASSGQGAPVRSPFAAHAADAPADLAIQSVNGGYALQITPSEPGELRSAAWWDSSGNRLMYRETGTPGSPTLYIVSQADQPVGIARKILLDDASIPAVSSDGSHVAVIDPSGAVRVGAPGALGNVAATGALLSLSGPDGSRPARALWQPHQNALLYATQRPSGVAFVLQDLTSGNRRVLATTATALDAAFSPDGTLLLVRTPSSFELWTTAGAPTPLFSWPETDPLALPWWSPDSRAILVQDASGWNLVNVPAKTERQVIAFPSGSATSATTSASASWTPASGDPWSPGGGSVVFAAPAHARLNGTPLAKPARGSAGLYVAPARSTGIGQADLIYSGTPRQPGWGYSAPDTVFLAPGDNA